MSTSIQRCLSYWGTASRRPCDMQNTMPIKHRKSQVDNRGKKGSLICIQRKQPCNDPAPKPSICVRSPDKHLEAHLARDGLDVHFYSYQTYNQQGRFGRQCQCLRCSLARLGCNLSSALCFHHARAIVTAHSACSILCSLAQALDLPSASQCK